MHIKKRCEKKKGQVTEIRDEREDSMMPSNRDPYPSQGFERCRPRESHINSI